MSQVTVGEYLFTRLQQLGVGSVFGVPGDYNLQLLDYIDNVDGIRWVGNCNELQSAYAADGYARIAKRPSALVTTFGVGELSALNGIAGSMAEKVPVIHIVGVPSTLSQAGGEVLHHSLGNGDFHVFARMSEPITMAQAFLAPNSDIAAEIDRVLRIASIEVRPVYLGIPSDFVARKIDSSPLQKPIDTVPFELYPQIEALVVKETLEALYQAKSPIILVDCCVSRYHVIDLSRELIEKSGLRFFQTPMSKAIISETHQQYGGSYNGGSSSSHVKKVVESSDLVISLGSLKSDWNTGGFTYGIKSENTIELHSTSATIRGKMYAGIRLKYVLDRLIREVDQSRIKKVALTKPPTVSPPKVDAAAEITHKDLWPRIQSFLQKGDIVVAETGTSSNGITGIQLPEDTILINQVLWGSIGYSVGATLGALAANHDYHLKRRTVLFVGDGSLQLTATEISTMVREGYVPIIFVINNGGYTVERTIHGKQAVYNDIQNWKYTDLLSTFGAKGANNYKAANWGELETTLEKLSASNSEISLVEVIMDKLDAPEATKATGVFAEKLNAGEIWGV